MASAGAGPRAQCSDFGSRCIGGVIFGARISSVRAASSSTASCCARSVASFASARLRRTVGPGRVGPGLARPSPAPTSWWVATAWRRRAAPWPSRRPRRQWLADLGGTGPGGERPSEWRSAARARVISPACSRCSAGDVACQVSLHRDRVAQPVGHGQLGSIARRGQRGREVRALVGEAATPLRASPRSARS